MPYEDAHTMGAPSQGSDTSSWPIDSAGRSSQLFSHRSYVESSVLADSFVCAPRACTHSTAWPLRLESRSYTVMMVR